jgi:hypothetical protein
MRSAVLKRIDPRYTFSRRIEAELDLLSRPATMANTVRGPRRVFRCFGARTVTAQD